jgi:RNA polymerase sigma-70 factor (ECF subfamily)
MHMEANEMVERLVSNHREFLAYLQRKVGDRALAEDILNEAFVRGLENAEHVREETATHWFYRVLRNAVIDHARRRATASRRLAAFAQELEASEPSEANGEAKAQVCQCVARLAETLRPDYAEAVRRVELEGMSVKDFAELAGITASNAGVRIFRAREALRKQVLRSCGTCAEHGCVDCTCGHPTTASAATKAVLESCCETTSGPGSPD